MVSHHDIPDPQDMTMAQYSTPFCVALACYRDPREPAAFSSGALEEPAIRALSRKVKLEAKRDSDAANPLASRVTVRLKDGRELAADAQYFPGMPQQPLTHPQLQEKFDALTASLPAGAGARIFAQLGELERVERIDRLQLGTAP